MSQPVAHPTRPIQPIAAGIGKVDLQLLKLNSCLIGTSVYIYRMNDSDPHRLHQIQTLKLSHGQTLLVIRGTRLAENMADTAFLSMAKKFRREHVPFEPNREKSSPWEEVVYGYEQLIELSLAFKMLADGISFRHITALLTQHRAKLHSYYREAYLEADTGRGKTRTLINANAGSGNQEIQEIGIGGMYLDFMATYSNGLISSPGPRLRDPLEATQRYMGIYKNFHPSPLIALSQICQSVVTIAEATPPVNRGRKG